MDSYYVICGAPIQIADHADRILNLAIGFLSESNQILVPNLNLPIKVRII